MKSDLIDVNQLKDVLASTSCSTEEYVRAMRLRLPINETKHKEAAMRIALEQPLVPYADPSELLIKDSGYPIDTTVISSSTIHADFSNTHSQTIIALQCKSCGGAIDRDTMTCRHCGMTHMLVNSSEINPRYSDL